ncbi:hypothetical protein [Methylobacterium nonmethylotrophicum]|uniref:Capsule polysaccharide biosynthesis protein n=1 Tax=Methylobacterium nonmethylotrophicum TaxID=1141884 RepID=A0A4Z0NGS5_9HYPH|nr:hypothetical protein [Methylobacterium nonmethylotrophicum]TGD94758.1 hypothetical protein EU555_30975 [Methylobacterium nonmethylotrophicum]
MNILFYVEPVSFQDNHLFFSPIMNIIRCIINANQFDNIKFGIATNESLFREYNRWLSYGGQISTYRKLVNEVDILEQFNFDFNLYAKNLFFGGEPVYTVDKIFQDIEREFAPDVIVCFTQNSTLEKFSNDKLVLFCERGPLPRWNGKDNFYFEHNSHQVRSILNRRISDIINYDSKYTSNILELFGMYNHRMPQKSDASAYFKEWIDRKRQGKNVALIANQPHNSIIVSGAAGGASTTSFMMRTLHKLPSDWIAVATYHPDMGRCSELDSRLSSDFSNIFTIPDELKQFSSEAFLECVDAVITIGSKVALSAALTGKRVVSEKGTMFSGISGQDVIHLDTIKPFSDNEAGNILKFLSNRYVISYEDLFEKSGYFVSHIENMKKHGDIDDFFLDRSNWNLSCLKKMYGE